MTALGTLIRSKRKLRGYSQESVAVHIGVSTKFVSLVENGERSLPTVYFFEVSRFLGILLGDMIEARVFDEFKKLQGKDAC